MAAKIENESDSAMLAVSELQRSGKRSLTMAWWGVCSALFYIFLSATLAVNYGSVNTIIGMILSVICYGLINSVLSDYAIRTGLSVSLFSRVLFGRTGAMLAALIFFATAMYYAVFEGSIIAYAANKVMPELSYSMACLIVVCYSVPLVFGSVQNWLDKLNGFLLPFYLIGLVIAVVMTLKTYGYSHEWLSYEPTSGNNPFAWIYVFSAYMGVWVLMMFTVDFARFGKKEDILYHRKFNFGIPFYIVTFFVNGLVGIFVVMSSKIGTVSETAVVDELLVVLGGYLGLIFILVTQTRINSANYYLATVNMQYFFEKIINHHIQKWVWAIIVGIVVLILMQSTNVFSYILLALTYQGIFVTAWVGVALTHILSKKYEKVFGDRVYYHTNQIPRFNPCGLFSWFTGAGVGFALFFIGGTLGHYSPIATFLVSCLVYYILTIKIKETWFVISKIDHV